MSDFKVGIDEFLNEPNVALWGGMECTINRVGDEYFDQLTQSGHRNRDGDIPLFASLGIQKMRYPILWEHHQPVKEAIDWKATEAKLNALQNAGVGVIAGLVHHGSGPDHVDIMDDSFVTGLAAYAYQVAEEFPWIDLYTPINEPLTTARFCGMYGLWHPHGQTDACFCRILVNECKATMMAMAAIRTINPNARLVQTDDLGKIHSSPLLTYQADFENERRWLSYDLLCGSVTPAHPLFAYLTGQGITAEELEYFCINPCPPDIIGINYYLTSERYLDEDTANYPAHTHGGNGRHNYADVEAVRVANACPAGIKTLLQEAWARYGLPLAITEVHLHCTRDEQMRWLNETWLVANSLKKDGVPIVAITPWALLGSFGWDKLLTRKGGTYEPGVFDISGGIPRSTILASMIRAYSRNQSFYHPVLQNPGWWHRHCRITYGKTVKSQQQQTVATLVALLSISCKHTTELAAVCRLRALPFKINKTLPNYPAFTCRENYWAEICVNEWLEIKVPGRADLVIYIPADMELKQLLNTGLDLLLDGASGIWEVNANGVCTKQVPDISPAPHFLAS